MPERGDPEAGTSRQMVFVPMTCQDALALRKSGSALTLAGHAATAALLRAHDYDNSELEDAEYAALCYAGVRAVLEPTSVDPLRLVLAAEVDSADVEVDERDPYGSVRVRLQWSAVRALFVDEPHAVAAVAAARHAAQGVTFQQAQELPAVESLDAEHDLLWFTPDELDHLPQPA